MQRILSSEVAKLAGKNVLMAGWVNVRRDHGKLIFIDLRDRKGLTQLVFLPSHKQAHGLAKDLRSEFVIEIQGIVNKRPERMINKNIVSGTVEIEVKNLTILNPSMALPFEVDKNTQDVGEEIRMKYRYLDLRTERVKNNILARDKMIRFIREYMHSNDFVEIETPYITKGTPEGAREYIIPSRIYAGKFYVLPQSPQQFKQLLMVAGFERYFQIARCFRDEDPRGDRQPEFTQLDFEMSFTDQEEIMQLTEKMIIGLVKKLYPKKHFTFTPFKRMTWHDANKKYKSDKPDLRKDKSDLDEIAACWIVDFPMFEKDATGQITTAHHPFTMPKKEDMQLLEKEPYKVRAYSYDLVINGYEISSGSLRIHDRKIQDRIFKILGLNEKEIKSRFGHILQAFEYGAPPHGGFAPGIDRLAMILQNEASIREVIAFPKTGDAQDLMMGAPSELSTRQINQANIEIKASKKIGQKHKHYKKL